MVAYFERDEPVNIISIHYENLVKEGCYTSAVTNSDLVANCTAQFFDELLDKRSDISLDQFHIIGLSLGAQVAGQIHTYFHKGPFKRITGKCSAFSDCLFIGFRHTYTNIVLCVKKKIKAFQWRECANAIVIIISLALPNFNYRTINCIQMASKYDFDALAYKVVQKELLFAGLDPAAPLFYALLKDDSKMLSTEDAQFVDVLHTNAGMRGKLLPIGHVDFYANLGLFQPGCGFGKGYCNNAHSC